MTAGASFVAAVDLGATSGRVMLADVGSSEFALREVARFANHPVELPDGLHWDILALYRSVLDGLRTALRDTDDHGPGALGSIGIDSWAVDYGLLARGRLLGIPYHYRDTRTAGIAERMRAADPSGARFRRTGLRDLPFNTEFQLIADDLVSSAERFLLIPDLMTYWLTGTVQAERTNASTTGLLNAVTREWDADAFGHAGIPIALAAPLVDPGSAVGVVAGSAARAIGAALPVTAVGSHDTASAVVGLPAADDAFAYVSCGTWGLVGLELPAPILTEAARDAGFTNELGVDGTVRFLRNVTGLWLLSESVRTWETADGAPIAVADLLAAASDVREATRFDVDDARFLPPGDMPARIAEWCREHGCRPPASRIELVRSIVASLAERFAASVHEAAQLAGRTIRAIHLVGGGAQNASLCQAVADAAGLPVLAGPVEATAWGNILLQARAIGAVSGGLADLRALLARMCPPRRFAPRLRSG